MGPQPTSSASYLKGSDANNNVVIAPNDSRIALIISQVTGKTINIVMGAGNGNTVGFQITANGPPLVLTEDDLGTSIQNGFVLRDSAGAAFNGSYTEITKCLYAQEDFAARSSQVLRPNRGNMPAGPAPAGKGTNAYERFTQSIPF